MNPEKKTRRSFLLKSTAALAATGIAGWFGFAKHLKKIDSSKNETVKMLTEDGRLVEIDKTRLPVQMRKIEKEELKTWVKK